MKNLTLKTLAALGLLAGLHTAAQSQNDDLLKKSRQIHDKVLTIDTHNDTPMRFRSADFNMGERNDFQKDGSRVDFVRMKDGGLDGAFFAVFTGQGPLTEEGRESAYRRASETLESVMQTVEKHSGIAGMATTHAEAYQLEKQDKRIVFIGLENGYPVGLELTRVGEFYQRGIRYITLCHSANNDICDSSTDRQGALHNGLSAFGREVVQEMNRLGMMVDVSHISDKSFYDVIELSRAPVIASHSSVRAICDSPRNLSDEMIKALAKNGGVIQICILSSYIINPQPNPERDAAMAQLQQKYPEYDRLTDEEKRQFRTEMNSIRRTYPSPLATVSDAVDHIDHVVKIAGIDHVGIGTDFDGGGGLADCRDVSEMDRITLELVKRGYTEEQIRKIWEGNIMRVLEANQKIAALLRGE